MAYSPSSINDYSFNPADPAGVGISKTNQSNAGIGQQSLDKLKAQMQGAQAQQAQWSSGGQLGGPNQQSGIGAGLPSAGLGSSSSAWAGDPQYAPWNQPHPCPSCGHCPTCGRGRHDYGYVPNYPPPYPYYGPFYVGDTPGWQQYGPTCGGTANTVGNENRIY